MKNVKKGLPLILVLFIAVLAFSSCGGSDKTYRVMVSVGEGASIVGKNPVTVNEGGSVIFSVVIEEGYVYESSEGAVFNYSDSTLTVSNVTKNTNIDLVVKKADFDPNEAFIYVFKGASEQDTTSVAPGLSVNAGTVIKLTAADKERVFAGWSLNNTIEGGGNILSLEREYEFMLIPSLTKDGVLRIYANYINAKGISYDANGGNINKDTRNMKSEYYTVSTSGTRIEVAYKKEYLSYFECASSFYDDGTFYRDGYVLLEYNTRADGTGTAYSLGSKVPMIQGDSDVTLYCIWSKATPVSDFTYEDITLPLPSGISEANAPHWSTEGVKITSYLGNEKTVTIPEKINGKAVTAIGTGAFVSKNIETLVLNRRIIKVEDNAFLGCNRLTTVYYPDGLYEMGDAAFDRDSYTSFKNFYVNATLAPRFVSPDVGALAVKLSRLLAETNEPRIIIIGGSSALQGIGSEYLEALFDGDRRVINFGTTRTTHGAMYLEAMGALAAPSDIILYSPENSSYMFGEGELYYKTFRDLEGMNNIYRYVDFSNYTGMFSSMTDLNKIHRYKMTPQSYEAVAYHGELTLDKQTYLKPTTNKYGDYLYYKRDGLSAAYQDYYFITLNDRVKSRFEGDIYGEQQIKNKDYTDPNNITWVSIDEGYLKDNLNRSISAAKASGAKVYFSFCPVSAEELVEGAEGESWQADYERLISESYLFDGILGTVSDYIYHHSYFYDSAFHLNDYGRAIRTYRMYLDLSELLGVKSVKDMRDVGESFEGCLFENGNINGPTKDWRK